jgi:nicotinate phosphoribosyltransferase
MIDFSATYTDYYQLVMAQAYFLKDQHREKAVFDYFFRKLPFNGGFAVFAGLGTILEILEKFNFRKDELEFLRKQGFDRDFVDYLRGFSFRGTIYSTAEGDIVFPYRPILQVEADLMEAQIIETVLLNILNFQTLIASKASRMRLAAGAGKLTDFGLRRSQGVGGYHATRAAVIGGFDSTSNVRAGIDFDIPVSGTMAHSFIQSYDDELQAFRDFADSNPDNCVLLVDTYNTLKSGVPNAIKAGLEMEGRGQRLKAIRLDSGDLAYLARESRKMLDDAGLNYVGIAVSNQLDEYVIKSLLEQGAPIDIFGVGTRLMAGLPDGALDGVYKMSFTKDKPRIKLSESQAKVTLPHRKQVYRVRTSEGHLTGADVIALRNEENISGMHHIFEAGKSMKFRDYRLEPLMHKVMEDGKRVMPVFSIEEIKSYSTGRIAELPPEYKRFENPHIYKIGLSTRLKSERDLIIAKLKKQLLYENTYHS